MSMNTSNIHKKTYLNNNAIWLALLSITAIIISIAIVYNKWLYLSILFIPVLLYFSIEKLFIFPFGLYVFFLPLDSIFILSRLSQGQALTKYLALLIISVLLLKGAFENKLKRPDTVTAILWSLFVLWSVLSMLWAIDLQTTLSSIRNAVGLLIFYLILSSYKIHWKEYETLKWFIVAGGIFAGAFSLFSYQELYRSAADIDRMAVTIGKHSSGLNSLAYSLLLPVAVCLEKILEQRKKLIKGILCICFAIIVFCIILTGCRAVMVGVAAIFAITILSTRQKISFLTVLIIIGMIIAPFIPDFFFTRWDEALDTGGAGRLDIWYIGFKALIEKYLPIGAGLGNFPMAFDEFSHINPHFLKTGRAAHNTYLGIFVELGIIGISLMILAMWKSYRQIQSPFKNKVTTDSIMLKSAFWGIIIAAFAGDSTWDKSFWLLFILISMHYNLQPHISSHINNLHYFRKV